MSREDSNDGVYCIVLLEPPVTAAVGVLLGQEPRGPVHGGLPRHLHTPGRALEQRPGAAPRPGPIRGEHRGHVTRSPPITAHCSPRGARHRDVDGLAVDDAAWAEAGAGVGAAAQVVRCGSSGSGGGGSW